MQAFSVERERAVGSDQPGDCGGTQRTGANIQSQRLATLAWATSERREATEDARNHWPRSIGALRAERAPSRRPASDRRCRAGARGAVRRRRSGARATRRARVRPCLAPAMARAADMIARRLGLRHLCFDQFSTVNPLKRVKSLTFVVATTRPCTRAIAAIGRRRRAPADRAFKLRPLFTVPCRSSLVGRQIGKSAVHDVPEIGFDCGAALAFWQPPTPIGELAPDWRRNPAFRTVFVETLRNCRLGCLRDRAPERCQCPEDTRVSEGHLAPGRPVTRGGGKSSSMPIPGACVLRNFLYASRKCGRFPRSRSNSRRETRTATGSPRRVSSISTPASAWSTILGRRDRPPRSNSLGHTLKMYIKMYMSATARPLLWYWQASPPARVPSRLPKQGGAVPPSTS